MTIKVKMQSKKKKDCNKILKLWIVFICVNFWDETWCELFWLGFFLLLSSSLLLLVVMQCFGCCILQPSSGIPCLSGHRNNSTWWIIFKIKFQKWFQKLNHFYAQINEGHLRKARGYSSQNVLTYHNSQKKSQPK